MRVLTVQTGWRYLVPVAVAGVIALVATGVLHADATASLPQRSAAQLVADLNHVDVEGFSGTVVQKSALGIALPAGAASSGGLSLASMLTGTNTVKVWYGGPTRQRVAVLDPVGETDMFRDGSDVWQWDSSTRHASFVKVPTDDVATTAPTPTSSLTPDRVAQQAIAAIGAATAVRVDTTATVAGRSVYRLVLQPKDTASRIGSVLLSLDGRTRVPLAAQVFARSDAATPAIDVSFTHVDFGVPDSSNFRFTPPPDAHVTKYDTTAPGHSADTASLLGALATRTVGTGWLRVAVVTPPDHSTPSDSPTAAFGSLLTSVSGTWGSGKLLQSTLLTVLFVDDGRIVIGAVDPPALYAAAGTP